MLAAGLAGCSVFDSDPLGDARAAFETQDYMAARDLAAAVLEADASDAPALELMARIHLAMGQGADAIAALDRLEVAGDAPGDTDLLRAEALLQTGETSDALALIEDDQAAEAWRLRALAARQANDIPAAARAFARGRNAEGDKTRLYPAEASFHLDTADLAAAGEAVALANDVAPDRVETLFVTARLAQAQGDQVLALAKYLRIIEKTPLDRPALLGAIAASEHTGQPGITRHLIAYGAETRPFDSEFIYQTARVDAWDGNWEAVRERMQAHEAELENHGSARLLYAEALLNLGQVETARAMASPVLARRRDAEAERLRQALEAAS
ncbi:TPR repeat protein [Aurantiacibacter gangjinensis]|nr:TPR repeat protein [Aurantiacibacter gangjinensis]